MNRTHALAVATAAAALIAAFPSAALASSVSTREFCSSPGVCNYDVLYVAEPGERNNISIPPREGGQVIVRDAGAANIVAGDGCAVTAPGEVRCRNESADPSGGRGLVTIDAGDQDDVVTASDYFLTIRGGDGNDVLTGSADDLDTIEPGGGDDTVDGGDGADDGVSYATRADDVRVNLDDGSAGSGGERDSLTRIESATGGEGDDWLIGSALRNGLTGGNGDDRLEGGDGVDTLDGENGRDRLNGGDRRDVMHGGAGNDTLRGGTVGDRLLGGSGNDRLYGGPHRNLTFGGSGNDFLDLVNDRREQGSCGRGSDRARIDRADRARSCERVTRVP
jgi:Ca2+-binding RTX toxin-like protein